VPKSPCVHVIDKDLAVRRTVAGLVGSSSIPVAEYSSGTEFLRKWQPDERGCVVIDQDLEDMKGRDLQRWMIGNDVRMPTILMSGDADVGVAVDALRDGAIDFLRKPVEAPRFRDVVHVALQAESRDFALKTHATSVKGRLAELSSGDRSVLDGMVVGTSYTELAERLGVSYKTVEARRAKVLQKMQVRNAAELTRLMLDYDFAIAGLFRPIGVSSAIAGIWMRREAARRKDASFSARAKEAIRASLELLRLSDGLSTKLHGE
jgi:two-component system response regulator FixJ